jgi:hypothetical protein
LEFLSAQVMMARLLMVGQWWMKLSYYLAFLASGSVMLLTLPIALVGAVVVFVGGLLRSPYNYKIVNDPRDCSQVRKEGDLFQCLYRHDQLIGYVQYRHEGHVVYIKSMSSPFEYGRRMINQLKSKREIIRVFSPFGAIGFYQSLGFKTRDMGDNGPLMEWKPIE